MNKLGSNIYIFENIKIPEAIKHVHTTLGYGLSESTYHKALAWDLKQHFKTVETEKSAPVTYVSHEITVSRVYIVVSNE